MKKKRTSALPGLEDMLRISYITIVTASGIH